MSDRDVRLAQLRYARDADEDTREAAAMLRCRHGGHEYSHWETVTGYVWDSTGKAGRAVIGHDLKELGAGQRVVCERICFWCFQRDYKRVGGGLEKEELCSGGMARSRSAREFRPWSKEMQEKISASAESGTFLSTPHTPEEEHAYDQMRFASWQAQPDPKTKFVPWFAVPE